MGDKGRVSPVTTLIGRVEEYRRPDRSWSRSRRDAIVAKPVQIVQELRHISTVIDEQYFVGTAQHESNFATNERDTEPPGPDGTRFVSMGIYQLSADELKEVGRPSADPYNLADATWIMVHLAEMRRAAIRAVLHLDLDAPDPPGMNSYLAVAHNQGLRAAQTTLRAHGLDWPAYKSRNPTLRIVSSHYGDDVLPRGL